MNDQERYWQTVNDEHQDHLDRVWKHADEVPPESEEDMKLGTVFGEEGDDV